jgi:hypothetical protein
MKNYPKIIFIYSSVYDKFCKEEWSKRKSKSSKKYPSYKEILNYIKKIEKLWKKEEKKVLLELSTVSHLRWKEKSVICYIIGRHIPFSMPLTMPVYKKPYGKSYFIDVLIHELIHNLFWMNYDKLKKSWVYIERKYKKESWATRCHIPLHALHTHIYLKFYNEKRLKRDIKSLPKKDYRRSWAIVQKEGYQKIINEFVRRII